jgi:hypothetical protein
MVRGKEADHEIVCKWGAKEIYYYYYLFTAIGFAPGGSSPTLVQTKTIKQHYTVVQTASVV